MNTYDDDGHGHKFFFLFYFSGHCSDENKNWIKDLSMRYYTQHRALYNRKPYFTKEYP